MEEPGDYDQISAWRSRGCVPAVIEVTASTIEIQQKDPHFRKDQSNDAVDNCRADQSSDSSLSKEMLAMLYCMAIMRLVNCVVEKTRKKNEVSIAEAADAFGIPRSLIDIRHEGSHRELPALQVVRSASIKALDWLKYYYWEPQKNAIPFQGTGSANIRNEIKSKFRELAYCLRAKMTPHLRSSQVKEKRGGRHSKWLCERNAFFSIMLARSVHQNLDVRSITNVIDLAFRRWSSL